MSETPSVAVAVVGRFHAFDLARQLQNRGMLAQLLTTYPRFVARRWGIPTENLRQEMFLELIRRYGNKIPGLNPLAIDRFVHASHARNARRIPKSANVFIGWSGSSLEAIIAAKKRGVVTILERGSSHCSEWRELMNFEYSRFGLHFDCNHKVWQRELLEYELADYISVPSQFVKRTFVKRGVPESKLLVNAYGVDLEAFRQVEKDDNVFRIICAGGFTPRKGFHYLFQAFSELDLPNSELWHLGSVDPCMRAVIAKHASGKIRLLGHKPQAELHKFYSQGSAFVMPSVEEGMAMVQCQALACGLPLICTINSGGEDLIGEDQNAGIVTPIRDVEALKNAILRLHDDVSLRKAMSQNAKQNVAAGLTWDDYGRRYEQHLHKVML